MWEHLQSGFKVKHEGMSETPGRQGPRFGACSAAHKVQGEGMLSWSVPQGFVFLRTNVDLPAPSLCQS